MALSKVDRRYPHQIALPDDLCAGHSYEKLRAFFRERELEYVTRFAMAAWPNGKLEEQRVHCFASPEDAAAFVDLFGGIPFDPKKDREGGRIRGIWRRDGEYVRILDQGPLHVQEALRN